MASCRRFELMRSSCSLRRYEERILLFSEQDMFKLVEGEFERGRLPKNLKIMLANLPTDLRNRLEESRRVASREMSPKS